MQVSLDKKIIPNTEVKFRVRLTIDNYAEESAAELVFRAPPALRSLNTLTFKIKGNPTDKTIENDTITFNFTLLNKVDDVDGRVNIFLPKPQNGLGKIKVGRRIIFDTPSGSPISSLDTQQGIITKIVGRNVNFGGTEYYKLAVSVPENIWNGLPSTLQSVPTEHIFGFKNQTTVVRKKKYRMTLDPDIRKELINKDNVKDVIVFGYKQFDDGTDKSDAPRYYMIDADASISFDLDEPTPKDLSDNWFLNDAGIQKTNITRIFDFNNGRNFIFFCTAVRYIKDKNTGLWTGDWLQKNSRGRPILAVDRSLE